jgi:hypothetical protein
MIEYKDLKKGEIYKIESGAGYIWYTEHNNGNQNPYAVLIYKHNGLGYVHDDPSYADFGKNYSNFEEKTFFKTTALEKEWYKKCYNDKKWYSLKNFKTENYEIY